MEEQLLNKVKQVINYSMTKSIICLLVLFILVIINYCYDEYYLLDVQKQIVSPAYSQSECSKSTHIPLKNPIDKFQLINHPFKFTKPPPIVHELLNIKITANQTTKICYDPYSKEYYTLDSSPLTIEITSKILNFKREPIKLNPLNLQANPMIVLVGGADGILAPLQSPTCPTKATNPDASFNCSRNNTNLTITEKDQNLILGASKENEKGIVIISQKPKVSNNTSVEPAIIEACDANNPTVYYLPQDSVIEIDCE
jgi:hypothetical protein